MDEKENINMAFAARAANSADGDTSSPRVLVRTPLALDSGANAEIVTFANLSDDREHIALIYNVARGDLPPLVRLHSECLTGDVLGSAQCDCGNQLREAQEKLAAEGGVLLYLRQEGRGIGLYNKISAYQAQSAQGLDTFAANRHLGFADDPRSFKVAAEMLKALGITHVRLLTNNPEKVRQLAENGIVICAVIPTGRFEKDANRHYLQTKRSHGHTL